MDDAERNTQPKSYIKMSQAPARKLPPLHWRGHGDDLSEEWMHGDNLFSSISLPSPLFPSLERSWRRSIWRIETGRQIIFIDIIAVAVVLYNIVKNTTRQDRLYSPWRSEPRPPVISLTPVDRSRPTAVSSSRSRTWELFDGDITDAGRSIWPVAGNCGIDLTHCRSDPVQWDEPQPDYFRRASMERTTARLFFFSPMEAAPGRQVP